MEQVQPSTFAIAPTISAEPLAPMVPLRSRRRSFVAWLKPAAVVAFFVLAGHVWSLPAGLWLDDHAHFRHLRDYDWSFQSAVETSRLGIVGEVMDVWGRREAGLRFFRPVAFYLMKIEYALADWQPMPVHAFSLAWHYLASLLVGALAMRCLSSRFWATVAACLMAIHPGHVATVYWIACQTELMTTTFLLAGILAYARHARWQTPLLRATTGQRDRYEDRFDFQSRDRKGVVDLDEAKPLPYDRGSEQPLPDGCGSEQPLPYGRGSEKLLPEGHSSEKALVSANYPDHATGGFGWWGVVAVTCYALALGCRENAILFPVVCWLGDRLCGARRPGWLRWDHLAMAGVLVVYLAMRWAVLGGMPMPARPYFMPIDDPRFLPFIFEKLVYYTIGTVTMVPVVPMGGQDFFGNKPVLFYSLFAAVVAMILIVWLAYGRRRAVLWPLVWTGCLVAPMLPIFASSHHLYLPCVGLLLLMTAALMALAGDHRPDAAWRALRSRSTHVFLAVCGVALTLATWSFGFAYIRGTLVEDLLLRDLLSRGQPIRSGDTLFFINLPLMGYYTVPAIETELGVTGLRGHVLTFATHLEGMREPVEVAVLDDRRLRIRAPASNRFFEGVTGRTLFQVMGFEGVPRVNVPVEAGVFTVTPTAVDDRGVVELLFTFREPMAASGHHFYIGSPQFLAYPLDARRAEPGNP